jgi:hypothetical protein
VEKLHSKGKENCFSKIQMTMTPSTSSDMEQDLGFSYDLIEKGDFDQITLEVTSIVWQNDRK